MRCCAALAGSLSMVFVAACAQEAPPMPPACTATGVAGYERALVRAPAEVRLPGGVAISECLQKVRTDAELQNLGSVVHAVAEDLAGRAQGGSRVAAGRLGYLSGAVTAGAGRSNGIGAELARRVETASVSVADDVEAGRALRAGAAAGAARG
ncbi:hypothetical protein [Baekduia alba]|uniref:hypothetical protein n=1 Tax=Baekduia alba TaxID=2997333 RepID=UPI002341A8AD|nr:hypothetical protein [Baekduia alba]